MLPSTLFFVVIGMDPYGRSVTGDDLFTEDCSRGS